MSTWVYFLLCERGTLYVGVATDPIYRFKQHRAGKGALYTRTYKPLQILGALRCSSRTEALSLEYRIKRLPRLEKRRLASFTVNNPTWCQWRDAYRHV